MFKALMRSLGLNPGQKSHPLHQEESLTRANQDAEKSEDCKLEVSLVILELKVAGSNPEKDDRDFYL